MWQTFSYLIALPTCSKRKSWRLICETQGMLFGSMSDIEHALNQKAVTLHAKVKYRWQGLDADGNEVTLTVGQTFIQVLDLGSTVTYKKGKAPPSPTASPSPTPTPTP